MALTVAIAFFMEQLDSTVLTTALPTMAEAYGVSPTHMSATLTAYLVGLTAFIPASGMIARRFGGRRVFCAAIVVFTAGSILCSLADSLPFLDVSRFIQGLGGAMMSPVGRMVLMQSVPKSRLIKAMTWVLMPASFAAILGPLVGGVFVTYLSWQWIFYINIPIGVIGLAAAFLTFRDTPADHGARLDGVGLMLLGLTLSLLVIGIEALNSGFVAAPYAGASLGGSLLAGVAYWRNARRQAAPIVDFTLLRIPTFRTAAVAGTPFRLGQAAIPFLMPMMLQLGFGLSAVHSGALIFTGAVASLMTHVTTASFLRVLGYRTLLLWNCLLGSAVLGTCALFRPDWPEALICAVLVFGGVVRSLQFDALSTLVFANVPVERMSGATSAYCTLQQVTVLLGISLSAALVNASMVVQEHAGPGLSDFTIAFLVIATLSGASFPLFLGLARNAGAELSRHGAGVGDTDSATQAALGEIRT
jgi:EmrB/QacA subfamily drug resistance transporter